MGSSVVLLQLYKCCSVVRLLASLLQHCFFYKLFIEKHSDNTQNTKIQ